MKRVINKTKNFLDEHEKYIGGITFYCLAFGALYTSTYLFETYLLGTVVDYYEIGSEMTIPLLA